MVGGPSRANAVTLPGSSPWSACGLIAAANTAVFPCRRQIRPPLLLQLRGFEGLLAVRVLADAIEPAAAELASPEGALVDFDSAAFAPATEAHGDKCAVRCRCDLDLLRLDQERLPGIK